MQSSKISIIVPVYNEERYIDSCLTSIVESNYNKDNVEVLIVDGGSDDKTTEIIKNYQKKYSFFKLLENPEKIAPISMNIGIKESSGDYLFIISAHASYGKDYFKKLVEICKTKSIECAGPVLITSVKNKTKTANAIKNVLSDKLGVGSAFRSGVSEIKEVDTVPFGCYKREVFDKIGLYDERLVRNQDIELNKRLKKAGGKIFIVPEIIATYYARENFIDLANNNFQNGRWNMLTAYYTNSFSSLSFRHYVPLLFVLSLLLPLLCCYQFSFMVLFFYLSVITIRASQIKRGTTLKHQILAFVTLHLCYGFGEMIGIIQVIKARVKGY